MKPGILFPILFLFLSCSEQKDKHLGLQPYGSFPTAYADSISKTLTDIYGFKVSILSSKDIPSSTFINVKSPRYRADKLLKILKKNKSDSLQYLMGLLEKDISTTKKDKNGKTKKPLSKYEDWGIFGLGYRPGPSSVVSTFRFRNSEPGKFMDRLKKICTHELGHNLGLEHCRDKDCVMTDAAESIKTIDNVELALCQKCKRRIQ